MDEKVPRSKIIETEIPMGTVHPAALEFVQMHIYGIHAELLKWD